MSALLHPHRWAIRPRLRPQPRRNLATLVPPELAARCPDFMATLRACVADVWEGEGRPGPGWEGWTIVQIPLEVAISLPVGGES